MSILTFDNSFLSILKASIEDRLHKETIIGKSFKSADSFSYLVEIEKEKYVAKIYRFEDWPPRGKLQTIEKILDSHNIPHEEYLFIEHSHPVFTFGWSLSRYIPGGAIRELRENKTLNEDEYYSKIGKILKEVHTVSLEQYGAIHKDGRQFKTFADYAQNEIEEQHYQNLSESFPDSYKILEKAKNWVLDNLSTFRWSLPVLVHDDVNEGNVLWNNGSPIIIDWTDSLASVPVRDFTTLTFREDRPVLTNIEKGYETEIDRKELRFHQIMRFIRLGRFYYIEDKNLPELEKMTKRLEILMQQSTPFGD